MKETILGDDSQKRQEIHTSTNHACFVLNRHILPIARELQIRFVVTDSEPLTGYVRNPDKMKQDYIGAAVSRVESPYLQKIAGEATEKQWNEVASKYPLPNKYILQEILPNWKDYVEIIGGTIDNARGIANEKAISDACKIVANEQDLAKREEINNACKVLNEVFNGRGELFSGYIAIQDGAFVPLGKVYNYKPLIYGK